jgi:hypothetical protein
MTITNSKNQNNCREKHVKINLLDGLKVWNIESTNEIFQTITDYIMYYANKYGPVFNFPLDDTLDDIFIDVLVDLFNMKNAPTQRNYINMRIKGLVHRSFREKIKTRYELNHTEFLLYFKVRKFWQDFVQKHSRIPSFKEILTNLLISEQQLYKYYELHNVISTSEISLDEVEEEMELLENDFYDSIDTLIYFTK